MSGTPSKRRKIEKTWESLVKDLPPAMVEGIDDLPRLLSTVGPLSAFSALNENMQKCFLCSVLGEESPLIPLFIEGAKEKQVTLLDKVQQHELAPSTPLRDCEVMEVLCHLFGIERLVDYRKVICWIKEQSQEYVAGQAEPSDVQKAKIDLFTAQYSAHMRDTLHVSTKEASGYTMLGIFSHLVCEMLQDKYPTAVFHIDPQFYVSEKKTYSSDQAVLQIVMGNGRVLVIWEYKPRVPSLLGDVQGWHLSETLLQAYYLRKKHSYPILHCLTDLNDYHYFFIDGERSLKLEKYVYIQSDLENQTDVWKHVDFLFQSVNVVQ